MRAYYGGGLLLTEGQNYLLQILLSIPYALLPLQIYASSFENLLTLVNCNDLKFIRIIRVH